MEDWRHDVPAVLIAWYSGMEGGAALADVLLGTSEPGGRLPFVIPRRRGRPAAVRQERDHGDLRPVARPATARPGRQVTGVPARLRPLLHHLHRSRRPRRGSGRSWRRSRVGHCRKHRRTAGRPRATGVRVPGRGRIRDRAGAGGFARVQLAARKRESLRMDIPLTRLASRRGPGAWAVEPGCTASSSPHTQPTQTPPRSPSLCPEPHVVVRAHDRTPVSACSVLAVERFVGRTAVRHGRRSSSSNGSGAGRAHLRRWSPPGWPAFQGGRARVRIPLGTPISDLATITRRWHKYVQFAGSSQLRV